METGMINLNDSSLALNGGNQRFISFLPDTADQQIKLYNALNSNSGKVGSLINKEIELCDVVIEPITMTDTDTGSLWEGQRVTLILKDGTSYGCVSRGIVNSLRNISAVFGTLHFPDGLPILIKQIETKRGRTFSIQLRG